MGNVEWLASITAVEQPLTGYQQRQSDRVRAHPDDEGRPVTRMLPRALMLPPGIPEFLSRRRIVEAGTITLEGRAWSGQGPIASVDVSTDGGTTWNPARLGESSGPWVWRSWTFDWEAVPGERVLCCRAADQTGETQPSEPPWNVGGYSNNAPHAVDVRVV